MIKALVADDEKLAREEMNHLLSDFEDVRVVAEAANGPEAWEAITEHEPDVVFMDIHMPGLSGMEVARALAELEKAPRIVFVTAFDQYAVEAFETEAIDYLLKPIEPDRLAESVDRVRKAQPVGESGIVKRIEELLGKLGKSKTPLHKLSVKRGNKVQLVEPSELIYLEVQEGVVRAVGDEKSGALPYRSLDEAERDLGDANFFRASRTHLINLDRIKEVLKGKEGAWELVMDNRETAPLSRAQARKLRKIIKW